MIFNEATYFLLFLLPSVVLFHALERRWRPVVLAVFGGLFFLYYANIHFGGAWGSACVLIFCWELLTSRLYAKGSIWCILGIIQAVAILVLFKYLGFLTAAYNDVAGALSFPPLTPLAGLVMPLGLSFFTFEFIHFAVESYRGSFARPTLARYAAFIFFFPTMVAGPIKRYADFEPQLLRARWHTPLLVQGTTRILAGLVKKHVLADTFSLWSDRLNTDLATTAGRAELFLWILAYGMKIYFDFSGYSDIAIGSGNLFGMSIKENFNWPYLSRNIGDFWRRWHISLGRWIFDYIYVPLGGGRASAGRAALNLMIAFGLSGLWHGAAYNFIAWGLWHGFLSVLLRLWDWATGNRSLPEPVAVVLTFLAVNLGWGFFCMDLNRALLVFARIFLP